MSAKISAFLFIWVLGAAGAMAATPVPENCLEGFQTLGIGDIDQRASALARYALDPQSSRQGFSGEVIQGALPADFGKSLDPIPADWGPGMKVRVKIPIARGAPWTSANQWALVHEANVSAAIAPFDPKGLFVREVRDSKLNVDVMKDATEMVSLREWMDKNGNRLSIGEVNAIEAQLDEALEVLRKAKIVHSDLNRNNILVDPKSLKILVIDYGISAPVGTYAPQLKHIGGNGSPIRGGVGPYMSPGQAGGAPAALEDDAHAVRALKHRLESSLAPVTAPKSH